MTSIPNHKIISPRVHHDKGPVLDDRLSDRPPRDQQEPHALGVLGRDLDTGPRAAQHQSLLLLARLAVEDAVTRADVAETVPLLGVPGGGEGEAG
jgi:hypothetical protein